MTYLLARLGRLVDDSHREIFYRGEVHLDEVGERVAELGEGELVLLGGYQPPWRFVTIVPPTPWPNLEHPRVLWAQREREEEKDVKEALSTYGAWCIDPRGRPCELGRARRSSGAAYVLNYAGWRMGDFPSTPIHVWLVRSQSGEIWLITPDSVPVEIDESPEPPSIDVPAIHIDFGIDRRDELPRAARTLQPPTPTPPNPAPSESGWFDRHVRFRAMRFHDGRVDLHLNRCYRIGVESSRQMYEAIRRDLDAEHPEGLRVVGTLHSGGRYELEVRGLEDIFQRAGVDLRVAEALQSEAWLTGEELARAASPRGSSDLDALLNTPVFGLADRVQAFRKLFSLRNRKRSVLVLPGRDVIVPVEDAGEGPDWYVWERVRRNSATYLFQPQDDVTRERVLAWIGGPTQAKRKTLIESPVLRETLAFKKRVIHTGEGADFEGWWHEIRRILRKQ